MANLVLLCPLHHRAVHEGGWQVEADDKGVLRSLNPLGVEMPLAPKAPDVGGLLPDNSAAPPLAQDFGLAHWHGRKDISPWAGSTVWQGERIEWGWALDWFCSEPGVGESRREGGDTGGDRAARAEAR